ncbi:hypothetical protein BBJ28_00014382 [Nothophytophthora sp. Chile5]|nr:hypothetical protein BBJ28_00014382 [Nothophytophthora sp. Chile5]
MSRLPPAQLTPNLKTAKTQPCNICSKPVRGDFQPIFCHNHRNNVTPVSGWAFFMYNEVQLINILRQHGLVDIALVEVTRRFEQIDVELLTTGLEETSLADFDDL